MEKNFTDISKKIEQRALAITEALEQESKALDQVEQTLNKHYKQSVSSVISSLISSMEEQEKERLSQMEENFQVQMKTMEEKYQSTIENQSLRMWRRTLLESVTPILIMIVLVFGMWIGWQLNNIPIDLSKVKSMKSQGKVYYQEKDLRAYIKLERSTEKGE